MCVLLLATYNPLTTCMIHLNCVREIFILCCRGTRWLKIRILIDIINSGNVYTSPNLFFIHIPPFMDVAIFLFLVFSSSSFFSSSFSFF